MGVGRRVVVVVHYKQTRVGKLVHLTELVDVQRTVEIEPLEVQDEVVVGQERSMIRIMVRDVQRVFVVFSWVFAVKHAVSEPRASVTMSMMMQCGTQEVHGRSIRARDQPRAPSKVDGVITRLDKVGCCLECVQKRITHFVYRDESIT